MVTSVRIISNVGIRTEWTGDSFVAPPSVPMRYSSPSTRFHTTSTEAESSSSAMSVVSSSSAQGGGHAGSTQPVRVVKSNRGSHRRMKRRLSRANRVGPSAVGSVWYRPPGSGTTLVR